MRLLSASADSTYPMRRTRLPTCLRVSSHACITCHSDGHVLASRADVGANCAQAVGDSDARCHCAKWRWLTNNQTAKRGSEHVRSTHCRQKCTGRLCHWHNLVVLCTVVHRNRWGRNASASPPSSGGHTISTALRSSLRSGLRNWPGTGTATGLWSGIGTGLRASLGNWPGTGTGTATGLWSGLGTGLRASLGTWPAMGLWSRLGLGSGTATFRSRLRWVRSDTRRMRRRSARWDRQSLGRLLGVEREPSKLATNLLASLASVNSRFADLGAMRRCLQ